jgi:glucitol operon activator protein
MVGTQANDSLGEAKLALWQIALIVLGFAWAVQSLGVWLQMRHYQNTFGATLRQCTDGRLGTGAAPGRLGKGVIVLLVVDPGGGVRKLAAMQGRTVFAKFADRPEFKGLSLAELQARIGAAGFERGLGLAIGKAIEQIERVDAPTGAEIGRRMAPA